MNDKYRWNFRLNRGGPDETGFVRFAYRPFDNRWLYWEKDTKLLDEKRVGYNPHVFEGNLWIEAREREAKEGYSRGTVVRHLADNLGNGLSSYFPAWLRNDGIGDNGDGQRRPNLSATAERYLSRLGLGVEDLFHHILATLHRPSYREANAGALRMEWPRIPLPGWPDGDVRDVVEALSESAARGRELAMLLDPDTPVPGVTQGPLRPETAAIAVPATITAHNMALNDFAVTAGWGHYGKDDAVMPGQGHAVERTYTLEECTALGNGLSALGETTFDVYLNATAFWRNIPAAVWNYKLGGYQVLKKWLSYRERAILGRPLRLEEVQQFIDTARRIAVLTVAVL